MENGGANALLSLAKKAGVQILKTVLKWLFSLLGPWAIVVLVVAVILGGVFGAIAEGDYNADSKSGSKADATYVQPYKDAANAVNPQNATDDHGDIGATTDSYQLDWGIMYAIDTLGNNMPMDVKTLTDHAQGMAKMLAPIYTYKDYIVTTVTKNGNKSTTATSTIHELDKVDTYAGTYTYHYSMTTTTYQVGNSTVTRTAPEVSGVDQTQDYTRLNAAIKKYAHMTTISESDRTMVLELKRGVEQQQQNLDWIFGGSDYNMSAGVFVDGVPANLMDAFNKAGQKYNIPPTVLMAIADVESTFRADAVGPLCADGQRAEGLMQFKPSTWKEQGVDGDGDGVANIFDPIDAIYSAANYLHYLVGITGSIPTAVKDYGEGTIEYQDKVMKLADQYAKAASLLSPNSQGYVWPLEDKDITQYFGNPDGSPHGHDGVDIGAPVGRPVVAVIDGTIFKLGNVNTDPNGGNSIMLKGKDGNIWYYAHLSQFDCQEGETVKAGQVIGNVGMTGHTTGSHLHFGLMINGQWYDPLTRYQK